MIDTKHTIRAGTREKATHVPPKPRTAQEAG